MNLRQAVRSLVHDWRFSTFVLLIIAAGIGLNTAIYSLVSAILFQPLPLPDADRLVRIYASTPDASEIWDEVSFPVYTDYRDQAKSFAAIASFAPAVRLDLTVAGEEPKQIFGGIASGNFFETLGAGAFRGRTFTAADDRAGSHVAVISHDFWRRQFGGREEIIGRGIRLNATQFTVVGVAPPLFQGASIDTATDVWLPSSSLQAAMPSISDPAPLTSREMSWTSMVGRLRDGVTLAQAQAELRGIAAARAAQQGEYPDPSATLVPASEAAIDMDSRVNVRRVALLVMFFVGLILVIACVNAGSLQLVRGERRQRELAIRAALGASRGRIVRQLALEALLLAGAAGALGVAFAHLVVRTLTAIAPDDFPLLLHASLPVLDVRVLGVTAGLMVLSAFFFGVVPALRSARPDLVGTMKGQNAMPRAAALRSLLVVVQIALSVVLLVFAGLMLRTLWQMRQVDPGFPTANAVTGMIDIGRQGYPQEARGAFYQALRDRLAAMPGVDAVGLARSVPVARGGMRSSITVPGYTPPTTDPVNVELNVITPGYFAALGIPILRGRDLTDADFRANAPLVVINEAMARKFWPDGDAVGRPLKVGPDPFTVAGVVKSTRSRNLRDEPVPMLFQTLAQFTPDGMTAVVRSRAGTAIAAQALRSAVRAADPDLPLFHVQTLEERLGSAMRKERTFAILLGGFGALALLLATVGLFGVVAYRTAARRKELAIRIAHGAGHGDIAALVVRGTVLMLLTGVATGLGAAALLTRFAETLLFGVATHDPTTFVLVPLVLLAVGVAATWGPVRAAMRIAPARALRYE